MGEGDIDCKPKECNNVRANAGQRLGAFQPQCEADGKFKSKQCDSSTGHCWCVEPIYGKEIRGTRKGPGQGQVICGSGYNALSSFSQNNLFIQMNTGKDCNSMANSNRNVLGAFVPKCKSNGHFEEKQCHSSTGACWCVESKSGEEVVGTRRNAGEQVNCEPRACLRAQTNSPNGGIGAFNPKCKSDGSFERKQCHSSTGHCWCVEPMYGNEIDGTRKAAGEGDIDCKPKECNNVRANAGQRLGAFQPQCEADGKFKSKQCDSSTGHCWCVEPIYGKEIRGTRKGPGQGQVICGSGYNALSSFSQNNLFIQMNTGKDCNSMANSNRNVLGAFVPKCKSNGHFEEKQCHSSTGACW